MRANSGEEALRKVLAGDFAAILLDVQMPGMSGFEVARLLRARPRSRTTPIIFLTAGESREFPVEEAYGLGAVDYLMKPIVPAILRAKVEFFIDYFRQTRQLRDFERRDVEATLREQRELWRTTLSCIGDAVIASDLERRVTFMNREAERLTGWAPGEAEGRPLDEVFCIVNETTRERVPCPVRKVLDTGLVVGLANHTVLIARDGTEWPLDDSAAPIRDGAGEIFGVVLVFREITERKQAEDERERLLREVETERERLADVFQWAPSFMASHGVPAMSSNEPTTATCRSSAVATFSASCSARPYRRS
ncbi:MAG TPA: PAS domain S-box protein [Nannocystis sp.]